MIKWGAGLAVVALAVGLAARGGGTSADLARPADRAAVLGDVLTQVYGAFVARDEAAIYDALAQVATGPVVEALYLQRAAVLAAGDAALVSIDAVAVERADGAPDGPVWRLDAAWRVTGTVTHQGHSHGRVNRYVADLTLVPVAGAWKISAFSLRDQARMPDPVEGHLE